MSILVIENLERFIPLVYCMHNGMRGFILGLGTMVASVTLGSLIAFSSGTWSGELPLQVGLLKLFHDIYSFLLTPLSSALGAPSLGGGAYLGILPLIIWVVSAAFIGLLTGEPYRAAKIVFTSTLVIFSFWIFSNFMLYPIWSDNIAWLSEVDKLMSDLFLYRSLDIIFFLAVPSIVSAASAFLIFYVVSSKSKVSELEEEQYAKW